MTAWLKIPWLEPMNTKHRKTLQAIFALPTRANLPFADIEQLLLALGAELTEGSGSRIKLVLGNASWQAHRPHPGKDAKKYQIEQVREFLQQLEIHP